MDPRHQATASNPAADTPVADDRWTVPDLLDFEYFLDTDEQSLRAQPSLRKTLVDRDRATYLGQLESEVAGLAPHTPEHRRRSLRGWLLARRASVDESVRAMLPGQAFGTVYRVGTGAVAVLGFLLGVGVASTLLSYDGHRPVSVPWFVFLLVVVQFLVLLAALVAWAKRGLLQHSLKDQDFWLLHQVIRPGLTRATRWLQQQRLAHATAALGDRVASAQGMMKGQFAVYGWISLLTLVIPAQVFGVAFNLGVILTTISLEWFTDLAFGWGTSLVAHPQTVYDIVRMIASPWSWLFGEGVGYPTLEQIEGSRVYLEQWAAAGAGFHPDPEHLRSWRWFLVLAVFTYGLLPRSILLGISVLTQRLALDRLSFTHGRIQALYARMLNPCLDSAVGATGQGPEMHIPAELETRPVRSGLVGPLTKERPAVTRRPWREAPAEPPPAAAESPLAETPAPPAITPSEPVPEPVADPELRVAAPDEPTAVEPEPATSAADVDERQEETAASTPPGSALEDISGPLETEADAPAPIQEAVPEPEPEPESESEPVGQGPALEPAAAPEAEEPASEEVDSATAPQTVTAPADGLDPEPAAEPEPEPEPKFAVPVEESVTQTPDAQVIAGGEAVGEGGRIRFAPDACLLLVHVDIDDVLEPEDRPRLESLVTRLSGWRTAARATFGAGSAMTVQALSIVEAGDWQAPPPRVVIVQDGSQPPITENLVFLRELRATAGSEAQMLLALVGDPEDEDRLPPLPAFDYRDWQRKIDQMADPYLRLEMLAPAGEDGEV